MYFIRFAVSGPQRNGWISQNPLSDTADQPKPILYDIARSITVFCTVNLARAYTLYGGNFKIILDDNYSHFLEKVYTRDENEALITVSNHRSLADDTTMFSSILPYWMNVQPKYLRNSLCAQEYCFNKNVSDDCFVEI